MLTYISKKIRFKIRKPISPTLEQCCRKKCNNCIWPQYYNQLKEYKKTHFSFYKQK